MLKKILLSTILTACTIATAQIQLDLDVTITNEGTEQHIVSTVVVDNDCSTPFEFNDITLILSVNSNDDEVLVSANILEKTTDNELVSVSNPTLKTTWNTAATVSLGNADNDSLIFTVTPSQI